MPGNGVDHGHRCRRPKAGLVRRLSGLQLDAGHDRAAVLADAFGDTSSNAEQPRLSARSRAYVCSPPAGPQAATAIDRGVSPRASLVGRYSATAERIRSVVLQDFTGRSRPRPMARPQQSFGCISGRLRAGRHHAVLPARVAPHDRPTARRLTGYGYFDYYNGYQTNPATGQPSPTVNFGPGESSQPTPLADGQAGHFDSTSGVGDGWYSYNLGGWHIISLNIECATQPGGCNANGTWFAGETAWLKHDLALNHAGCTRGHRARAPARTATPAAPAATGAAGTDRARGTGPRMRGPAGGACAAGGGAHAPRPPTFADFPGPRTADERGCRVRIGRQCSDHV